MSTALVIALIALTGSVASSLVTVFGAPAFQARRDAKTSLDRYREPLLSASYELQARLYNILRLNFTGRYIACDADGKRDSAVDSTLYVFAQFFGWQEITRQRVHYLRFSRDLKTRQVGLLLYGISEAFLSDEFGSQFMIWRLEQRGIGERMMITANGEQACLGYARFLDRRGTIQQWLDPMARDLQNLNEGGRDRLTVLQHLLVDLVLELDDRQRRYPVGLERA